MAEHDVLVFLLSLAILLTLARGVGEGVRWLGFPLIVGEISAGILLGPTVLGRLAPHAQRWLFDPGAPSKMLAGYTNVAAVLLLVVAGLEVNLGIIKRRGRSALLTSLLGIVLPLAGGFVLGQLLPDADLVRPDRRFLFAMFIGVALSISALPVIAKTLLDLGLFKTEIGLLVMTAAMVDDLVGWLAFSVLLGPMTGGDAAAGPIVRAVSLTVGFVVVALLVGRPLLDRVLVRLQRDHHTEPRRVLSLVVLLALFGASFTQWVGIHAVFGGFVVGVTAGDSRHLKERVRAIIHEFVTTIFAPVFFASLGLRVDFVKAFDLRLCVLVFVIATAAKVIGCTLGSRAGGMAWRPAAAIGFGLNARGAMEIILALLALDAGLIREQVFVALVVMALATSLISGPAMALLLRNVEDDLSTLIRRGAWTRALTASSAPEAIEELLASVGTQLDELAATARQEVFHREGVGSTGLGDEVAIPHAAVEGLKAPLLALGFSEKGIDFNAPDGRPSRIVFLLLVPPRAPEREVRLLAAIARAVITPERRTALLAATTKDQIMALFGATPAPSLRSSRTSLADY
jgi:Kef-type K+ transport system membrane component KefB/mannitol/fructose-specific phosphotransferase system IIA component (Ntr-type)